MYSIHFRRKFDSRDRHDYTVIATGLKTLDQAREARQVSGDLVVWSRSGMVVFSPDWLWQWEVADPSCYAQQARKAG